jgi:AraC family transcriptional activator of pyochelin receptor
MSFKLRDTQSGRELFRQDFTAKDFDVKGLKTDAFNLSLPFGEMRSKQWAFDGIRMTYSELDMKSTGELDWSGGESGKEEEMITMHFNLKGKISLAGTDAHHAHELSNNQHNIFYGTEASGKLKAEELKLKQFLIQFSKDSFLNIAKNGNDSIKRFSDAIVKKHPVAFSKHNLNIDFSIQNCINKVLSCNYADSLKQMFLFSKTIEMLVLQAESFDRNSGKVKSFLKSDYDKERILYARDYMLKNMDCPPSLSELSKVAGINEYKLKKGFKETFNHTIFEYLSEARLELAKIDLLEKKKTATEIAFELGYSSLQHFSSSFKKKFGVSPSQLRK